MIKKLVLSLVCLGWCVQGGAADGYILTPHPSPQPRINGAKVFGVRPGHPVLYMIAATGQRPMTFAAEPLPAGLKLDTKTGILSGSVTDRSYRTYKILLKAENALGRAERELRLVVGNDICLTPLLGCNTWGGWGAKVTDANLRAAAEAMVKSGLINHGWQYINIDDGWQGRRGGQFNAIQPNEKFPDMRALTDYIHSLGLKAGIYSTPWATSYAGFCGGSSDDASGAWIKPAKPRDGWRCGQYLFEANDAKQWAEWGFDYAKYDWGIDKVELVRRFAAALADCDRDIVFELSNSLPLKLAPECLPLAQLSRTTGDLVDLWDRSQMDASLGKWAVGIREVMIEHDAYAPCQQPGHWNHACNLRIGLLGGWRDKPLTPSRLTPDEQYAHISLWCLWSSPMIIGTPIEKLDEFTLSLLSNDEVLEINQDPLGRQATRTVLANGGEVLVKDLEDGTRALGIFNPGNAAARLTVTWAQLGLRGTQRVRDLWRQQELGIFGESFSATVPRHGVVLVKLTAMPPPRVLHVAPQGNDTQTGIAEKPFATLERARDAIRKLKQAGRLPPGGVEVQIAAGRYEWIKPLELTAEDAGTAEAPICYRVRPGAAVRISGGQRLKDWQPVTDPAILKRLDPAAAGKVYWTDLKAQGITEYGDLGLDAAAEVQLRLAKVDGQGEDAMGSAYASRGKVVRPRLELFYHEQPMEIARWPNEGFIQIQEVLGKTEINVRGTKGCKEGLFVYEGDRPRRWVEEPDAWVQGYWFRDWAEQRHRIATLDVEKRIISVLPPYHDYGYRKGQWFRGFNLLCEIDEPGEWYLDRRAGLLYFWPPGKLDDQAVEVSMASGLFALTNTAHVTLRGLLLDAARGTAVTINHSTQCRIEGCTFRNLGNHAVTIMDGQANGVIGCDLYGMGGGGIYLVGGDRKTLAPAGHFAENNHIHHFGRWDRMYRPGLFLSGVGLRAAHNLIHDAPHSAILFGGNDHLIEFNEIHNVCQESHDCGAIYAGRSWTLRGHIIQYNYLHHLSGKDGGPCNGVYLDDLFSSAIVQGNIFFQVLRPVFVGGGRDNFIQNNVFVDCPKALHVDARALGWCGPHADGRIKEAQEKGTIAGIRYKEPPYSTRYPQLVNLLDDEPKKPKGNIVRRNIFWQDQGENLRRVAKGAPVKDTWWDDIETKVRPLVVIEDNLINIDPLFVDASAGNFQLRADSPAWKLGFQKIPVEQIGLYRDDRRTSWPVQHPVRPLPESHAP